MISTYHNRIQSIDVLRGFDMLMIVLADQFFLKLHEGIGSDFTASLARQFTHPEWLGFRFYDIIMPLFLFVVGAVIPFSISKYAQNPLNNSPLFLKLIKRFFSFLCWDGSFRATYWILTFRRSKFSAIHYKPLQWDIFLPPSHMFF